MTSSSHSTPEAREARFRALHEATYADLLRFAGRRVHPSHAEDVAAEALTVAWRRLDDLPAEPDAARAWVFGVARGVMLNQRRGERRRQALAVRLADGEGRPTDPPGAPDEDLVVGRLDLARAWRRLTPAEQEVLGLAVLDDLDSAGAGRVLGCSAVAFRLRLSRARKALRGHLDAAPPSVSPIARGLSR